jgi:hypothetical protein
MRPRIVGAPSPRAEKPDPHLRHRKRHADQCIIIRIRNVLYSAMVDVTQAAPLAGIPEKPP